MSGSSAKTSSSQAQTTDTQNLNLQDSGGVTVANSKGVNISTTDQGAVKAGVQIAQSGLNTALDISSAAKSLGGNAISAGTSVANAGLDFAQAANTSSLDFASDIAGKAIDASRAATDRVAKFANTALDANTGLATTALGSQQDLATTAINAVSDAGKGVLDWAQSIFTQADNAQAKLVDQNISGLTALASQVSQSSQQTSTEGITKVVMYIALAAGAFAIFRGSK